ncbi:serine hydrolase domain-containing protein [Streptantibioticus cattleyicolor]|uniref:Putative peptidase n=1 Tax=Streptantibioticus cattleyicolor (strain ATCC 35852 / DSM 46488 / JCM 4925 / NBRC 14057 / NRRL 8057) TaxID=1003195 RepID=F8JMD2_STREN|nr:serine hydrolase domain-containing protein [Streptantibioticus cattleyicolor]AEW99165.1 putative peptidase [Streptantibioticus cattleyicolor NRRL 8057 = DSM 46488]CCB71792.1 putative D-alanyl-D-alanine carboxypeptidase [Streptantibioticus cattleyicolor NRRL 8057 = DSM 46488]
MTRHPRRAAAFGLVAAAVVTAVAATGPQASAAARHTATAVTSPAPHAVPPLDPAALRAAIEPRTGDGAAGVIARVGRPGQLWTGSTTDSVTGRRIPPDAHFHIGSISKTFESVIALQLASEGKLDLDRSVQQYLPGLLPDTFRPITVRQLLDFTSGLPDVDEGAPAPTTDEMIAHRYDYRTFDQVIEDTLRPAGRPRPGPHFAPGTEQEYNSLGFRIAGKLIEHLTGHSFKDEVTARVLEPLRLTHTSVPEDDPRMPRPYLHGYLTGSDGRPVDVSEQGGDPSNMISTPADLDHFITALFSGRLLPAAWLDQMFTLPEGADGKPVPYHGTSNCVRPDGTAGPACFGVGLMAVPLPGGGVLWGKTGHDYGYANGMFATRDLSVRGVFSVSTTTRNDGRPSAIGDRLLIAAIAPHPARP